MTWTHLRREKKILTPGNTFLVVYGEKLNDYFPSANENRMEGEKFEGLLTKHSTKSSQRERWDLCHQRVKQQEEQCRTDCIGEILSVGGDYTRCQWIIIQVL